MTVIPHFLTRDASPAPALLTQAQRRDAERRNALGTTVHMAMHQLPKADVSAALQQALTRDDWTVAELQDLMLAIMNRRDQVRGAA